MGSQTSIYISVCGDKPHSTNVYPGIDRCDLKLLEGNITVSFLLLDTIKIIAGSVARNG